MKCGFIRVTYIKGERVKYVTTEELKRIRPSVIKTQEVCTGKLSCTITADIDSYGYGYGYDDTCGDPIIVVEWFCSTNNHSAFVGPFDRNSIEKWVNEQLDADSRTLTGIPGKGWQPV